MREEFEKSKSSPPPLPVRQKGKEKKNLPPPTDFGGHCLGGFFPRVFEIIRRRAVKASSADFFARHVQHMRTWWRDGTLSKGGVENGFIAHYKHLTNILTLYGKMQSVIADCNTVY